ncbi:MAG: bifunctional enoyl-CoA hydratase/phosphate acetyltransferase [Betaproteobacteria bacterium]|nr:bifunctional enoyl-CoA hydratase/phosphate acetyltransferase [Betaproteobacteria bacterium]
MRLMNRIFSELQPGESAELKRLITTDDLFAFAACSGNYNPLHLADAKWSQPQAHAPSQETQQRVAPGLFVASLISAVLGTQLPGAGTLYRRDIGAEAAIRRAAEQLQEDLAAFEIIDVQGSDDVVAAKACALVREGRAAAVMKGHLHTDDLLRPMLDKTHGLRAGRRFTHVFVMDVPGMPEPLMVTDAAINIAPDLATKVDICQNAIDLARSIGMEPRVGVLSAVETVNPAIQSSIDAALLSKMADRGQIRGGLVDGPLAMDNAVDIGAARTKGLKGGVAGQANILLVPGLDAGNMLAKQLAYISHAEGAGVVLGAKVPVILNSRSDSAMSRLASCAVAVLHHASHQQSS